MQDVFNECASDAIGDRCADALSASARASGRTGTSRSRSSTACCQGGELISEGEIAEALGMSRTPVRAAFAQLESEGLLRLYPKRGALVVPVVGGRDGGGDRDALGDRALRASSGRWRPGAGADDLCGAVDARTGSTGGVRRGRPRVPPRARRRAPATRSCSRSTTRCATASAGWAASAPARPSAWRRSWTSTASSPTRSRPARPSARSRALRAHLDSALAKLRSLSV